MVKEELDDLLLTIEEDLVLVLEVELAVLLSVLEAALNNTHNAFFSELRLRKLQ